MLWKGKVTHLLLADLVDRMLMCLICFIGEGTYCDITTAPYHTNARLLTLVLSGFLTPSSLQFLPPPSCRVEFPQLPGDSETGEKKPSSCFGLRDGRCACPLCRKVTFICVGEIQPGRRMAPLHCAISIYCRMMSNKQRNNNAVAKPQFQKY